MFNVLFTFFVCTLVFYAWKVEAILPLSGKVIIIDVGHGAEDVGTSYGKIYEKDINLAISKYLQEELSKEGAIVSLTRDDDYDLSTPRANYRKRSDFDNRIKKINESKADMYVSIHINYLSDSNYKGPQVFYNKENEELAKVIQEEMNKDLNREVKKIPSNTYMYNKLNVPGVLIECGFLSNPSERELLINSSYQKKVAESIAKGIVLSYK